MSTYFNYTIRKIFNDDNVETVYVKKAYASVSFRGNTTLTELTYNTWTRIKTDVAYTLGSADSGNCEIVDNGDNTYNGKYIDSEGYERTFLMNVSITCDFSVSGVLPKTIEFRMGIKRSGVDYAGDPFTMGRSLENIFVVCGSTIQKLQPNDEVFFEMRNITNGDDLLVINSLITVSEV